MHQGLHGRDYVPIAIQMTKTHTLWLAVTAFGLASAVSLPAASAPFGLVMGAKLSDVIVVKKSADEVYEIKPPVPNSEFETYFVRITPTEGLCKVIAVGRDHGGDTNGVEIRQTFSEFERNLGEKYGDGRKFDFLKSGSIWKENGEWAMAVSRKERSLAKFWDRSEGSRLPNDIAAIQLEAKATDRSTTYLALNYELSNYEACTSHRENADKSAL